MRIGIEIEVLLTPSSHPEGRFKDLEHFCISVARIWDAEKTPGSANMHVDIDGEYDGGNEDIEWSITDDETLRGLEDAEVGRCE